MQRPLFVSSEKALRVVQDREVFSAKASGLCYLMGNIFWNFSNYGWLCVPEKTLKGLGNQISGRTVDLNLGTSSADLPFVQISNFMSFGWNYFPFLEKSFRAKNIITWQVNFGYGTSCAVTYL
jgi:hypothetical protein